MERNLGGMSTGKCGIAMEASYPVKEGQNPPNPGPSPPSPVKPPAACDSYFSCSKSNTCCCVFEYGNYFFQWGCCPLEAATCCDDHERCCPQDFPVCNANAGTCMLSKDNPFGVKAMKRTAVKPNWAFLKGRKRRALEIMFSSKVDEKVINGELKFKTQFMKVFLVLLCAKPSLPPFKIMHRSMVLFNMIFDADNVYSILF